MNKLTIHLICFVCRKLKNGRIELGVHIADVSYFVRPESLADLEARSRYEGHVVMQLYRLRGSDVEHITF